MHGMLFKFATSPAYDKVSLYSEHSLSCTVAEDDNIVAYVCTRTALSHGTL